MRFTTGTTIEVGGGRQINCVVRNLSVTGAAIELSDPRGIPDSFVSHAGRWIAPTLPDRAAGRLSDRRGVRLKVPSERLRKITALLNSLVSHRAERFWSPIFMQLLASRDYPVIDYQTSARWILLLGRSKFNT